MKLDYGISSKEAVVQKGQISSNGYISTFRNNSRIKGRMHVAYF